MLQDTHASQQAVQKLDPGPVYQEDASFGHKVKFLMQDGTESSLRYAAVGLACLRYFHRSTPENGGSVFAAISTPSVHDLPAALRVRILSLNPQNTKKTHTHNNASTRSRTTSRQRSSRGRRLLWRLLARSPLEMEKKRKRRRTQKDRKGKRKKMLQHMLRSSHDS